MAVGIAVPVEEYPRTSYRPDCDYVDGEVVERNLGVRKHSRSQREILYYLRDRYSDLRERIYPEQRLQVKTTRFRIPDVCITARNAPDEEVVTRPPALCIEILSRPQWEKTCGMREIGENPLRGRVAEMG